jgi:dCMP deaminase
MKQKFIDAYMDTAKRFAQLSTAKRLQVGAIVVKDDRIISIGYNGTPPGWDNECEYEVLGESTLKTDEKNTSFLEYKAVLITKPEVIHAEANAIAKLAKSTESGKDSTMFLTHAPCIDCAKQIFTAGINKLYYREQYRSTDGIDFLKKCNVEVIQAE